MKTLLTLVSLALGLVLAAELWWYFGHDWAALPPVPAIEKTETEAVLPPRGRFKLPDELEYEEVWERPLFVEGRRPPSEEPVEEPEPEPTPTLPPAQLTLVGVFITPAGKTALVRNDASKEVLRVGPEDEIAGWKIGAIEDDQVVVKNGDEVQTLELRDYSKPPPPPKKQSLPRTSRTRSLRTARPQPPRNRAAARALGK